MRVSADSTVQEKPPTQLEIRAATISDLPHVVRFNIASASDQGEPELDYAKVRRAVRRTLKESTRRSGAAFYLLSVWDGQPIGHLRIQSTRYDWSNSEFWQIQHVYVEPMHRLHGVCRALLREAQRLATLRGVENLHLLVARENHAARQAYERGGFQQFALDLMVYMV